MIAVMVEKGMDWKQAVVPMSTKSGVTKSAAPSPAQPTAPADTKLSSSDQYVSIFLTIYS